MVLMSNALYKCGAQTGVSVALVLVSVDVTWVLSMAEELAPTGTGRTVGTITTAFGLSDALGRQNMGDDDDDGVQLTHGFHNQIVDAVSWLSIRKVVAAIGFEPMTNGL